MVKAGLIAAYAGIDFIFFALGRFVYPLRVGQHGAGHGDHVGITPGQDCLGGVGHIDSIGGDQGNVHFTANFRGHPGECGARYHGSNGGNTRLVPADAGIDHGGTGLLNGFGQLHNLIPTAAAFDQVKHGQAVNNDKVLAHPCPGVSDHVHRQADALGIIAAPLIIALIGAPGNELIDEVALRTHDLDTVVPGLLGQLGTANKVVYLFGHFVGGQCPGHKRCDRGL